MKRTVFFAILITYCLGNSKVWAQNLNIVSVSPQPSSNNISLSTNITITFDLTISAASLNGSSVIVRGSQTGIMSGVFTGGGSAVITFNPDNNYRLGEVISVTITRTVLSQTGFNLSRGHTYSFTAVSGTPPVNPPTFAQRRVNFTSGSSPAHDITALDFDKDGDLDLIVGVEVPQGLTELWENDGNQGFCKRYIGNYENVEVHDIDGDGDLDSFGPGGNGVNLNWYRNEGDGGPFTTVLIAGTNVMWSVTGGDLDSDGDIDAVAMTLNGNGTSSPKWYTNNGAGVFTLNGIAATITSGVETETYLYLADINTDGVMDILVYRDNTDNIVWYENNGAQVFNERIISSDPENLRLATADVDGDGDLDILSASNTSTVALSWYENDGNENFTKRSVPVSSPNRLYTVEATDVDGDLDMDMVAGGYWFENDGTENFTQRMTSPGLVFQAGASILSSATNYADLDRDGDMDLLTLGWLGNGFRWQENVRFMNVTANTPANASFSVTANSNITVTFDQPIATASITANSFRVISNLRGLVNGAFSGGGTNTITFNPAIDFLPGEEIEVSITDRVKSLAEHRLEKTHGFDFKVRIPVAVTSPTFTASAIITHASTTLWMDVADMDGDSDLDVISCASSQFFWHRNDGSGNFTSLPITTSASPRRIFASDYNNDGNMDIVMQTSSQTMLYMNDGNENFSESILATLNGTIYELTDITRDGDTDALAGIRWLDRNCDSYSISAMPTLAGTASAMTAGDLDNDGDIDFFRSTTSTSPTFLLNDGYLNYTTTPAVTAPLIYTELADLDGDGDLDALGVRNNSAIVWFDNNLTTASQNFGAQKTIGALSADPRWLVATDLDGDGDLDVAAISRTDDKVVWYRNQLNEASANFGVAQNLPVVSDRPIFIYSGDMNGDGKMDLVVMSNVDNELNWYANSASAAPLPTITSFTPTSGIVGTTVTIIGTNFSTTPSNNSVKFNNTTAVVTASTATSITTTVPVGATTGKITVTVAGNTATSSSDFTVLCGLVPTITSFSPSSGTTGTTVIITGTNFSTTPTDNAVDFNGAGSVVTASTTTSITTTVPSGASGTGPISVTVGCNTITSSGNFTVICAPAPTITSFTPTTAAEGDLVTITGTDFSTNPSDNLVDFNGTPSIVTASTTTSIATTVPVGATTGPITVLTGCYSATSTSDFIVDCGLIPTISSFSPASAIAGTLITITGTNFSTTLTDNLVDFNGVSAVVTASTATTITAEVPVGATTGPISIGIACNYITSTTNFNVTAIIAITTQPVDVVVCEGNSATFSVTATGATNITYQWQYSPDGVVPFANIIDGGKYANAATSTLLIQTTDNFGAGRYRCTINGDLATTVVTNVKSLQ